MATFGTSTSNEKKPTWLSPAEKERCFATKAGWELRHPGGATELLACVKGLTTKLGASSITDIVFGTGTYTAGTTKQLKVSFNEKVNVTGVPTIAINKSTGGTVVATYASSNADKTTLTFDFLVPAAANTLSVAAQSVLLAGGTILEVVAPNTPASLVVTAGVAAAAKTKVSV